jgi:hypothetical protein
LACRQKRYALVQPAFAEGDGGQPSPAQLAPEIDMEIAMAAPTIRHFDRDISINSTTLQPK